MNIWTQQKKPDKELSKPIIKSPGFKEYLTQQTIEEGLANSVYAYVAWTHHHVDHMLESAVKDLFLTPCKQIIKSHMPIPEVEITTRDLYLFHNQMNYLLFKKCLRKINKIIAYCALIHIPSRVKHGPGYPVLVLKISLIV